MASFDSPSINVLENTNEENLQITKSYLTAQAEELNYELNQLEERILALESKVSNLEEGDE